ncbi:MAG TPA: hypothetical protein VF765_29925 [Polyangiaceae bacterium]
MKRPTLRLLTALAAAVVPVSSAWAADPTTADCLDASDASLQVANQHKLRAERSQLLVCAATSCPADIRKECLRRVDEVNAQIPTMIFEVKDPSGRDIAAVKVSMDGEVLAERLQGTALSVDPGEHTFRFETAGQDPVTRSLVVQESQKERHEVVNFGTAPISPSPSQPAATPVTDPEADGPSGGSVPRGLGTQRVLALVAGGVGVIGIGLGTAFGLMALAKKGDAQSVCAESCTTQDGVNKWSDAATTGNLSTAGFIVGGIGLAGGAVLWITAPSTDGAPTVGVGLAPGSIQLNGAW